jgi:hypothetical protein
MTCISSQSLLRSTEPTLYTFEIRKVTDLRLSKVTWMHGTLSMAARIRIVPRRHSCLESAIAAASGARTTMSVLSTVEPRMFVQPRFALSRQHPRTASRHNCASGVSVAGDAVERDWRASWLHARKDCSICSCCSGCHSMPGVVGRPWSNTQCLQSQGS